MPNKVHTVLMEAGEEVTMVETLAGMIADGYWTLCTPQEAVDAFLSEATAVDWWAYDTNLDRQPTDEEVTAAIALFLTQTAG